jgi:uncharacterized SAM-binding protein YcdF (DUF218 family)
VSAPSEPKPARRRGTRRIVAIPLVLLILWVCGLIWYAEDIPRGVADAATPTDAVVVLTGGSGRLDVGFALLAEGRAKKLFISGVAREVNIDELIRLYGQGADKNADNLRCCIAIGHTAGDTIGNARETAQWMAQEQFSSLRLVTASYHMRRSLLEFRRAMPTAIMIPHPVFPQGFRAGEWWRWPGTLNLLISEYTKFVAAVVGQTLGIRAPTGAPTRDGTTPAKSDSNGKPPVGAPAVGAPAAGQPVTP